MSIILQPIHVPRCYVTKNTNLHRTDYKKNVFVSLTTTPLRINKIWPTLNSIGLQSVRPERIYLWIPKKYKRFPHQTISQLPDFIEHNPLIQVNFIEEDFGPATKLLPMLQLMAGQDSQIIVIDDDRIYARHFIRDLLRYEALDPSVAVGVGGFVVLGSLYQQYNSTRKIAAVDILLGSQGYLIKPGFFSRAVFEYPDQLPESFFEDDVWFAGHLESRGIRRIMIPSVPSIQSFIAHHKKTIALCRNENQNKENFMRVFSYFRQQQGSLK